MDKHDKVRMVATDRKLRGGPASQKQDFDEMCADCQKAAHVLRLMNFQDTIGWGVYPDAPTRKLHASHSNSGVRTLREGSGEPPHNPAALHPHYQMTALCVTYRSELAWLAAGRTTRPVVYMAHPVAGDFKRNVEGATRWLRYLRSLTQLELQSLVGVTWSDTPVVHAPYLAAIVRDKFAHPAGREGIIADCRATVTIFDEVWLVGGRISEGMHDEARVSKIARDLTHLGALPPDGQRRRT